MAGPGGDARAGGPAPERPGGPTPPGAVPAETLRGWDAAEARLFPLVMARPEEYQRALALIQVLLGWLRSRCPDIPALLAQSERGGAIVADAAGRLPGEPPVIEHGEPRLDDGGLAAGVRADLIAAAACAMRYRELVSENAARARRDALDRARAGGDSWAVVEEIGDQARAPYLPYQRVEAHVPSGRAVIISIEPDEMLNAVRRLDEGQLDPPSGRLSIGEQIGRYATARELDDALTSARARLGRDTA